MQPDHYGDVAAEYAALRSGVGLLDLSFRARLRLTGADRVRFLHNMLTNDIQALSPGSGCNAVKVSVQGKIEAALRVLCLENELWCDLEPGARETLLAGLGKRIVLEDVVLEDASNERALLSLQGPESAHTLRQMGVDVDAIPELHQHLAASLAGFAVRVARSDHTGDAGYDIWVAPEAAAALRDALLAAGPRVQRVGRQALDLRRIEAGIPWHERELTPERFPQEAGLDNGWISYTKGCYLGQETIARIHHMGHVNRSLCGLLFDTQPVPEAGSRVWSGDKEIGIVTSAAHSFRLDRPVALAYLRREVAAPGSAVEVRLGARSRAAQVAALPFA
ncbi:MAG: aminomethyltransferase family protein [Candidatus Latescibacterota bacterium]|nr:MAG: aminomethyltransferase family protein [Candidatus Latescibacterota bacterium]